MTMLLPSVPVDLPAPAAPQRSLFRTARPFPGDDPWAGGVVVGLEVMARLCLGALRVSTNAVQSITAPAGVTTFTLSWRGQTTAAITRATADGAAVQAALIALSNLAPGDVVVSGPAAGPWSAAFGGTLADQPLELLGATTASGTGTVVVATTTAGAQPQVLDLCSPADLVPTGMPEADEWTPFGVWAAGTCTSWSWQVEAVRQAARDTLAADASRQAARELWTGDAAGAFGWPNTPLSDAAVVQLGTSEGSVTALGMLEEALGGCAGGSMIHTTHRVATLWAADSLVEIQGSDLVTTVGRIPVVIDAGYTGSAPGNVAPAADHRWAYGTSTTWLLQGSVELYPGPDAGEDAARMALDRSSNRLQWFATQAVLPFFDAGCCHVGVGVDLTDRS